MHNRNSDRPLAHVVQLLTLVGLVSACMPSTDLDAHARGDGDAPAATAGAGSEPPASDGAGLANGGGTTSTNGESITPVALDPGSSDGASGAVSPGSSSTGDALPDAGSAPSASVDAGPLPSEPPVVSEPPVATGPAPALPDDLIDAPVSGEIVFSDDAEWEVDGVFQPTFEIHTPTASFWVVKPLGTIVSIEDTAATPAQWIAFSSGFRPLRGVPSFPSPPTATTVSTVRDLDSQTPTHVRLTAESADGAWQWVWDFYVTHVTFTINRAPAPFGFAYQGVPGGSLGAEDRLISNEGVSQGARSSFNADLAGPVEWAYLADTDLGRSLFAIQHGDDALPEHYQVRDNDTALLLFGNGQIEQLPMRFSLGIIPSVQQAAVSARVEFIAGAIH
jgi:hypothetical protein